MELRIDSMRDPEEFEIHCVNTGTFVRLGLTEAQGGTFVDGRMGHGRPTALANRVFDATAGRIYFRRWLAASLEAMGEAAKERAKQRPSPAMSGRARSRRGEMGDPGFEPGTSSLSETRSNQLS